MGESVRLTASDGHQLDAYLARPANDAKGGVVVCQEVYGVNDDIRDAVDDFAANGYLAIAPALFDRVERGVDLDEGPDGLDHGRSLRSQTDWDDIEKDVGAAVEFLRGELGAETKIGVVGFSWGGSVAWLAACRLPVQAAVGYTAGQIYELNDEEPQCPTMLHFGEEDPIVDFDQIEAIRADHPDVIDHIYHAGHAFIFPGREDYHEQSAALARSRTLAFLMEHVA